MARNATPGLEPVHSVRSVRGGPAWGVLLAAFTAWLVPSIGLAGTLGGGAGIDYASGTGGRMTKDVLAFGVVTDRLGDFTAAVARFDDANAGPGVSGFANAGAALSPRVHARVIGARMIGDGSYRAWRIRAGPEIVLARSMLLGVFYARSDDNIDGDTRAIGGELSVPLRPDIAAQGGAAYGRVPGGANGAQGTLDVTWNATRRFQVLAGVGLGQNSVTSSSGISASRGGILGRLPVLQGGGGQAGHGGDVSVEDQVVRTASFGIRILIP
jgi:hypothetical protein